MSITREFVWEDVEDVVDGGVPVDHRNWRHGYKSAYVVKAERGESWLFWVEVHHEDGIQVTPTVTATKVVAREKTVVEWVPTNE
jgi:hypothetical protein